MVLLTVGAQLPDTITEAYKKHFNGVPSAATLAHLRRELVQAGWDILLDDDELRIAYKHGFKMSYEDDILRLTFPRFFTYSADFLEK